MPATATDRLQGLSTSVAIKPPCKAVSTSSITLSGEKTVGSVACVTGDRVLMAITGGSVNNGIWIVDTGAWSRAKDFDGARDAVTGTVILVASPGGMLSEYVVTTDGDIVPGTTSIQIVAATASTIGAGLVGYSPSSSYAAGTVGARLNEELTSTGFASLQAAVTAAAGKRLHVVGSYTITAAVTVPAGTHLVSYGNESTITQTTNDAHALTVSGDNVTIEGLTIIGPNTGSGSAVRADAVTAPKVIGCRVKTWRYGIQFRGCKDGVIVGNTITGGAYDSSSASDIFVYGSSGAPSSRTVISGNRCLSNNDNGISADTNSGDRDLIISDNIIYPLDASLVPLADGSNRRRYGIIVGYVGTTAARAVVSGNVLRDIPYSGIYLQAATIPAGDVAISGNVVSRSGFGTLYPADASLRAGIFLASGGSESVTGNTVVDCVTSGIKIAPDNAYSSTNQPRAVVSGNNVARTTGIGIWLTNKPHGYLIGSNKVTNSTVTNVKYEATGSAGGNCAFSGNHIDSNGATTGGLVVDNSLGGYPCFVSGNKISGNDNTTNDPLNSGVWFMGVVHIVGNSIDKFHRGVNCADTLARVTSIKCGGNAISNTNIGVYSAGNGPWLVDNNTYDTVTTAVSGAAYQGVFMQGQGIAGTIHTQANAAPATGTWAVGDHVARQNQAGGSAKGWYCTVAGTAGTWVSEGNL